MGKHVKLYIRKHERKETVIDIFPAREWSDFLIITLDGLESEQQYEKFNEALQNYNAKLKKEIIVLPAGWDVEMYGVEIEDPE